MIPFAIGLAIVIAPQSQMQLDQIAEADFKRADAAMNAQYRLTMAAMRKLDEQVPTGTPGITGPTYQNALLAAQRAWLAFRDAECVSESYRYRGGTMEPMEGSTCMATLTRVRTKQLHDLTVTP